MATGFGGVAAATYCEREISSCSKYTCRSGFSRKATDTASSSVRPSASSASAAARACASAAASRRHASEAAVCFATRPVIAAALSREDGSAQPASSEAMAGSTTHIDRYLCIGGHYIVRRLHRPSTGALQG